MAPRPSDGLRSTIPLARNDTQRQRNEEAEAEEESQHSRPAKDSSRGTVLGPSREAGGAPAKGEGQLAGLEVEEETHWRYPSASQFGRAIERKGHDTSKLSDADLERIVTIHNMINERTWHEIRAFEALHAAECPCGPSLVRFRGRADEPSPKARFMGWLGYHKPFDRHDWVVDRCGTRVRYVVDFYEGKKALGNLDKAGFPSGAGSVPLQSVYLDVRPALTLGGFWDRARIGVRRAFGYPKPDADRIFADAQRHHHRERGPAAHGTQQQQQQQQVHPPPPGHPAGLTEADRAMCPSAKGRGEE